MKKNLWLKKIGCLTMAAIFSLAFVACGDQGETPGGTGGEKSGTINIYLPMGQKEQVAFQAMVDEYMYLNPGVTISTTFENSANTATYNDALGKQLSKDTNDITYDIVVNNSVTQYFSDNKFVDFSNYMSQENPYADDQVWSDILLEPAYRSNGTNGEIYSLSFESNQVLFFYNKDIFREAGLTVDGTTTGEPKTPETWNELVEFAKKIEEIEGKDYYGFTISGNTESFQSTYMGWLIRIYADQYFRSFIEDVRAQEGDYCYNARIDADWEYKPYPSQYEGVSEDEAFELAIANDSPSNVTTNYVRILNLLMNDKIGPNTAKYKDMLTNLLKLIPTYVNDNFFSCDQGTALGYFWNGQAGIYFGGADILKDYVQTYEDNLDIGFFYCPPMEQSLSDPAGAPDVTVTRGLGGPQGFYGIINKSQTQSDLCADFMMFWASPAGQQVLYDSYVEQNWFINGTPYIKGVEIPDEIFPAKDIVFQGECDLNPIQIVARGLGEEPKSIRAFQTNIVSLFKGEQTVDAYTATMQGQLKRYVPDYCAVKGYNANCYENPERNPF